MSWNRVQTATAANTSTATPNATWGKATTTGNTLIVIASVETTGTGYTAATAADAGRNTWTQIGLVTNTGKIAHAMFYAPNCVGGTANTVTVTFTGGTLTAAGSSCVLLEYSGLLAAPLDGSSTGFNNSSVSSGTTGNVTVSQEGDLFICAAVQFGDPGQTWTEMPGLQTIKAVTVDGTTVYVADGSISATQPGTYAWSGSHGYTMLAASFKTAQFPTPVQTTSSSSTSGTVSAAASTFAANCTPGNSVVLFVETNDASFAQTVTATFGTVTRIALEDNAANQPNQRMAAYLIPVKTAGNSITVTTGGSSYFYWMQEVRGNASVAAVGASGNSTSAAITVPVGPGQLAAAMCIPWGTVSGFAGTGTGTFTDTNSGGLTWANGIDAAYLPATGGSSATFTWTQSSAAWSAIGMTVTRATPLVVQDVATVGLGTMPKSGPPPVLSKRFGPAWAIPGVTASSGPNVYTRAVADTSTSSDSVTGNTATARAISDTSLASDTGFALTFDGSQNYVSAAGTLNTSFYGGLGSTTLQFWCLVQTTQTSIGTLFGQSGVNCRINCGAAEANSSGRISVMIGDDTALILRGYTTNATSVNDGNVHFVLVTANCASNTVTISVDGTPQTISYDLQQTPHTFTSTSRFYGFGAENYFGTMRNFLNGSMDLINLGTTATSYAKFDLNTPGGTTTADSSGQGNTGTLVGSPPPTWINGWVPTLTRQMSLPRTVSDTSLSSDAVTNTFSGGGITRSVSDTSVGTDAVTRARVLTRAAADTSVSTDSVARGGVTQARAVADTSVGTDAVVRGGLVRSRAVSDTSTGTDAVSRGALAMARAVADTSTSSDAVVPGTVIRSRTAADTSTSSDAVVRGALILARTASDTSTSTDAVTRLDVYARTTSDTSLSSDAVAGSSIIRARSVSDTSLSSDAVARARTLARIVADTSTSSDAVTRVLVVARTVSDTSVSSDAATRALVLSRAASDTSVSTDAVARGALILARSVSDTSLSSDSTTHAGPGNARGVADTSTSSDAISKALVYVRAVSDTSASSDAVTRATARFPAVSDTSLSSDAVTRARALARAVADTSTSSDVVARLAALVRLVSDTSTSADAVARALAQARAVADTSSTSDAVGRVVSRARAVADTSTTSDAVARAFSGSHAVADTSVSSDAVARAQAKLRALADFSISSDVLTVSRNAARQATDTSISGDVLTIFRRFTRQIADASISTDVVTQIFVGQSSLAFAYIASQLVNTLTLTMLPVYVQEITSVQADGLQLTSQLVYDETGTSQEVNHTQMGPIQ